MPNKETNNTNKTPRKPTKSEALIDAIHSNIELDSVAKEPKPSTPLKGATTDAAKPKRGLAAKSAMLHTYKEDVQGLVKKRKISMVRALAMQSDKKTQHDGDELVTISSKEHSRSMSTTFLLISSALMLVLGLTAILIAYGAHQRQLALRQVAPGAATAADTSLIFVEYRAKLNITDRNSSGILRDLQGILQQSGTTLGSITQVLLQDSGRSITQQELLQRLKLSLPEQFIRLMGNGSDYMVGIHVAERNTPFILLTTTSYEHAFASMLEWESSAERELRPFFNSPGGASLGRTPDNIVIKNLNARVMRDEDGNIRFLYSFLDERTILITNNLNTLTEISQRYKVRKASR